MSADAVRPSSPPTGDGLVDRALSRGARRWKSIVIAALPFGVLFVAWVVIAAHRPASWQYAVPDVSPTLDAVRSYLFASGMALRDTETTILETFLGLGIAVVAGVAIGGAMGLVRGIDVTLNPTMILLNAIPKVALATPLALVFGIGIMSKVVLAASLAVFPIIIGTRQGVRIIRRDEIDLMRSMQASRRQVFLKLRVRRAMPSIFTGLEVGTLFAFFGGVVGEILIGSSNSTGLGYRVNALAGYANVPGAYATLIVLTAVAGIVTLSVRVLGRATSKWSEA